MSDVSRKMQAMFSGDKIVEFVPRNSTDGKVARKVTSLVNAQLEDCGTPEKMQDFFLTADMYGTAFLRHGWKQVRRMEQFRKLSEDGQHEVVAKGIVTRFDGPNWDVRDMLDIWPQPGRRRISDCQWVMDRTFCDLSEIEALEFVGVYDKGSTAELKRQSPAVGFVNDAYRVRRQLYRNMSDFDARQQEQFNKVVEVVDMIGYVPDEMVTDGINWRIITVANDAVILKNRPMPFWHGQIPILAYTPMPDPHYIHGVGKIEINERLAYIANRWMSQKADSVDLMIEPMWLVNRMSGIDTSNMYTRAGRIIGVDGAVDDSVIRPFSPDMRGAPLAENEIRQIWNWLQQSTGMIEDTMMGAPSSKEQTATEYGGRVSAVMNRQGMELLAFEKLAFEPLCNVFHQLNRQFLKYPKEVQLIGEDAGTDPITGLPVPPEMTQIQFGDLDYDFRAIAVGGTDQLSREGKRAEIFQLNQLLGANPAAGQIMNWVNWLRYTFTQYGIPNTKDFFNVGQIPGVNQIAAMTGAAPDQPMGGAGGSSLADLIMRGQQ